MRKQFIILILTILYGLSFSALAVDDDIPMITTRHHPENFIASIKDDPQPGKKIYQQFCATCHARNPAIRINAPRIGVAQDWQPRMAKGIDGLLNVTIIGLNQMPPRGGCFECSDLLLNDAILYMLPKKKKPH